MGLADGEARLWSTEEIKPLTCYPKPGSLFLGKLTVSPCGKLLAVAGQTNRVKQYNLITGIEVSDFPSGNDRINSVRYSKDGKRLACVSSPQLFDLPQKYDEFDFVVRIHNVDNGEEQLVLRGHKKGPPAFEFTPDGKHILTAGKDQTIRLWDTASGEESQTFQTNSGIASLDILPNGKQFVTGHDNGTISLWDFESSTPLRSMKGGEDTIMHVAVSPNGRFLFSREHKKATLFWNLESGEVIRELDKYPPGKVVFSPDGKYYLTGNLNGNLSLCLLSNDAQIAELKVRHAWGGQGLWLFDFAFTPDGQNIVTIISDKVVLWE